MHASERVRVDKAFVEGITVSEITSKRLKKLNDKISAHGKCLSHSYCCEVVANKKKGAIEDSLKKNEDLWHVQNQASIAVTTRVFRTAYLCCMRYEPFTAHSEILKLQKLNGVDVGCSLHSDHACRNIACYIGKNMRQQLLDYVLRTTDSSFSLMFDESTSVSTETCLILYIRIVYEKEVCNFFLDLIKLKSQRGQDIADAILDVLTECGFTTEILSNRLIGVCTDGASNLQGEINGALALLKAKLNTQFVVFHCMAHKLELAVHDVLKLVTEVGHLQSFTDALYTHFSRSPKNQGQLKDVAQDLHVHLLKVCRTFDIRWVSSSFRSIHAIWTSYQALVNHFKLCSEDTTRNARERAKCAGLHGKLTQWFFVSELAIVHDALDVLRSLSLFLQKRQASVMAAEAQVQNTVKTLKAMKQGDGVSSLEVADELCDNKTFHGVLIADPSDADRQRFATFKARFFQALVDNLSARFSSAGTVLHNVKVLQKANWPEAEEERILFGDRELLELAKLVKMDSSLSSAVVRQFRLQKDGYEPEEDDELTDLHRRLTVLPVSSAECERGFSCMNATHTPQRNALDITTMRELLFIKVNGPPLAHFPADRYVSKWIKAGRHSASDRPSGRTATDETKLQHHQKLFC